MIDTFREIEQGYEAKFKLDEERRFKAQCRRNRLLGRWAAVHLGLTGPTADEYAGALVNLNLEVPGGEPIVARIAGDFDMRGVRLSQRDIIAAFERFQNLAVEQLANEYPKALDTDHVPIGG
jgi:hypothetical protein